MPPQWLPFCQIPPLQRKHERQFLKTLQTSLLYAASVSNGLGSRQHNNRTIKRRAHARRVTGREHPLNTVFNLLENSGGGVVSTSWG